MSNSEDYKIEQYLRQQIPFLSGSTMQRDTRGHSRATCFVIDFSNPTDITTHSQASPVSHDHISSALASSTSVGLNNASSDRSTQKCFAKVYPDYRTDDLRRIEQTYHQLQVNTANIVHVQYLPDTNETFCAYEFITGPTFNDLLSQKPLSFIENLGYRIGAELHKFSQIQGDPVKFQQSLDRELATLLQNARRQKLLYNSKYSEKLPEVDLDRLERSLNHLKQAIYATTPTFVHSDINLNNVIIHAGEPYIIDTDGGKIKFRALDFRGNCWWGWTGDNVDRERAAYRGIYRGLFQDHIPDSFHQELAFTMIYEFILRVQRYTGDDEQVHYSFLRWHDNLEQTNYFENYRFGWF